VINHEGVSPGTVTNPYRYGIACLIPGITPRHVTPKPTGEGGADCCRAFGAQGPVKLSVIVTF